MRPTSLTAYLAEAHRQDLFREARQTALAAEADLPASDPGTTVLLLASDLLLAAGHRLRARLARPPLRQVPDPAHHIVPCPIMLTCRYDGVRSPRVACLEA